MSADEERTRELEDGSHDHGAPDAERAGADARAHGVCDVVRADRPRHEQGERTG